MLKQLRTYGRRMLAGLRPAATARHCPICDWTGTQFATAGAKSKVRFDALCPQCGSLERHRLAYLVARQRVALDYSRVLHVAPERELSNWLKGISADYLSIDLYAPAMARMDITDLELDDASRTLIWASHVLEHVVDDSKAIAEMHRVLVPGGKAFIQVPVWRTTTFEDRSATTPERRMELFYQTDHVRLYGLDIVQPFSDHGFAAAVHRAQDFGPEAMLTHGLSFASTNEVFVFTK